MKLVFCGTPQFAVPTLEALIPKHEIALVVTQPDRPQGRGLELTASPVKQIAQRHNLRIEQPDKIRNNAEFRALLEIVEADAIVVVGYGRIIPPWMLSLPKYGNINLHGSLLPKYRGAAPIQWAIASGERVSGVTTMLLNEGLDTGDILLQRELSIEPVDTAITYGQRLACVGADLMWETLNALEESTIVPRPQDHSRATLAPMLKKEDGEADFHLTAQTIYARLRGFQPWPGCFTSFRGKKLAIIVAKPLDEPQHSVAGEVVLDGDRLLVGCRESALEMIQVQPEGKRKMSAGDFVRGYRPRLGEKLGSDS
jgi:methionyl-tRNA formyltransferase